MKGPSYASHRGRERREPQGERLERGKRGASTFFKSGSFDQREDSNWDNKRKNELKTDARYFII